MAIQFIDEISGSDASLASKSAVAKSTITAITKANPCQVTLNSHGFSTGDFVNITGAGGMAQVNGITFQITVIDANNFTLDGINSTAYTTYTSGGVATPAISRANPAVVCIVGHGFGNGQVVTPSAIAGSTFPALNGGNFKIKNVTPNTFELTDINGNNIDTSGIAGHCSNAGTWAQWRKIAIQGITKANPAVVTAKAHGYNNGDLVIPEVAGMTEINLKAYTVANKTTDTFELSGIDSSAYGTFTDGTVTKPFKTPNGLSAYYSTSIAGRFFAGDSIRIGKTFVKDSSIQVGSGDIVFQKNQATVTTTVDLRSVLSVGNFIGLTSATVEGCLDSGDPTVTRPDIYYKIASMPNASTIILGTRYAGTSHTASSVNRLRLGTEIPLNGAVGTSTNTTATTGCIWEGGYDFIHNTAVARTNGQTAFQPTTTSGDVINWTVGGVGETVRYIGSFNASRGFRNSGTNCVVEYCYVNSRLNYCYELQGAGATDRYCTASSGTSILQGFYMSVATARLEYSYGTSVTNSCISSTAGVNVLNCRTDCCVTSGFNLATSSVATNCLADTCVSGFIIGSNVLLDNCIGTVCNNAIAPTTTTIGNVIKGGSYTNNTNAGIAFQACFQPMVDGVTFSGNTNDITIDQYTSNVRIWNCNTNAPTNWFISRVLNGGTVDVRDCTIDAPSIAKAIQVVAGVSYSLPQYTLENSFGLPDGQYFANSSYVRDYTDYKTSGYSMKLTNNTTLSNQIISQPMLSYGVNAGTGRTLTFWLKAVTAGWIGSITPILRLGGKIIKVGTPITSLSLDWDTSYSISATGSEIDHDGELQLEFINNANTVPIRLDNAVLV
jgi:hypothetical protein